MKPFYWLSYWLTRGFFKLFFHLRVYGLEHFKRGSAIIASNHVSFYDPPVLSISCPEEVHFLAKESLFRIPVLGSLIKSLNAHPVAHDASDSHTMREMIELLSQGKKLILFPEGKRSETGDLLSLERGIAFLMQKSGCSLIPAYIKGSFDAWPANQKWPKLFGRISVAFGSPIALDPNLGKREAQIKVMLDTEEAIRELKDWLEVGAIGTPP